jgi:hypothetical protein
MSQWPFVQAALLFGTRVAETILASGHVRPHTKAGHMIAGDPIKNLPNSLARRGPFSNRSSAVKTSFTSPARVTVLSAVSTSCRNFWSGREAPALQGPQRAYA